MRFNPPPNWPKFSVRLAAAAAALALIAAGGTGCRSSGSEADNPAPQKPDITAVSPAMMVGREAGPPLSDWVPPKFSRGSGTSSSGGGSDEGCEPLQGGWKYDYNSRVYAVWATADRYQLTLISPQNPGHRDIADVVATCPNLQKNRGGRTQEIRVERQTAADIPSWATAYTKSGPGEDGDGPWWSYGVAGQYRGVDVEAGVTMNNSRPVGPTETAAVAKLFNDQIAKLEAEP